MLLLWQKVLPRKEDFLALKVPSLAPKHPPPPLTTLFIFFENNRGDLVFRLLMTLPQVILVNW